MAEKDSFLDALEEDSRREAPADKMEAMARLAEDVRQLDADIANAEERVASLKAQRLKIVRESLPEAMDQLHVKDFSVAASGNMPPLKFKVATDYQANIAASWTDERRQEAFTWLETHGAGDLIKTEISLLIPREQRDLARSLVEYLRSSGANPEVSESVHPSTMRAWFKERVESGGELPPLEMIGGAIFRVVRIAEEKKLI